MESGAQRKDKERQDRLAQKAKREKAAQQIEEDIKHLQSMFDVRSKEKHEHEERKRVGEQQQKAKLARKNARLARSYAEKRKLRESQAGAAPGDSLGKEYMSTPGNPATKSRDLVQAANGEPRSSYANLSANSGLPQRAIRPRGSQSAAKLGTGDQGSAQ